MRAVIVCVLMVAGGVAESGEVDTVGYTTYDWQVGGATNRMLCNAAGYGVHVAWTGSASPSPWPDRGMRYNYYSCATRQWVSDTGVEVFPYRNGFGSLDVNPANGVLVVSTHAPSPLHPDLARDIEPGACVFEYCSGSPVCDGYSDPPVAVGMDGTAHVVMLDDATGDQCWYSRVQTWCSWDVPRRLCSEGPEPGFHSYSLAASKLSHKVVVFWTATSRSPFGLYYRASSDGGETWQPATELPAPPAFGGDTVTSFSIQGAFPFYDREDRLHVAAPVAPIVRDTFRLMPAAIWHWCSDNSPAWSEVRRAGCDPERLIASVGYNALYAGRPTLGEDGRGGLFCGWEEFDSMNVEPQTNRLRAAVFCAQDNGDNGTSWQAAMRLTDTAATASYRYPCVIDRAPDDTLRVVYHADLVAGFHVFGEGPLTLNPVLVQKLKLASGVEAPPVRRVKPTAAATVVRGLLKTEDRIPETGYRAELLDIAGRRVMELRPGANDVRQLATGVYFVQRTGSRAQGFEGSGVVRVVVAK